MHKPGLSSAAFYTLLLVALMMGANHVAARFAFNNGVDVATAVAFRSGITAAVVALLLVVQKVPLVLSRQHLKALAAIGALLAVQSLSLYASVARLPVALALLAFNTYPIWTAFWAWALYRRSPERAALIAMPYFLIDGLFTRGLFTTYDSVETAKALLQYGWGVPAFVLTRILAPAFFARQDTKGPMVFALASVTVNVVPTM